MGKPSFGGAGGDSGILPPPLLYPLTPRTHFLSRTLGQSSDGDTNPTRGPCASVSPFAPLTVSALPDGTLFPPHSHWGPVPRGKSHPSAPAQPRWVSRPSGGPLSHPAYPSMVLSAGHGCRLRPGDAGAASAALLCCWIEEVKEAAGKCWPSSGACTGLEGRRRRGDAAAGPSRLHVMLRG